MPDRAVVDDDAEPCQRERKLRDERSKDYKAAIRTRINIESRGMRMEEAQDSYERCLKVSAPQPRATCALSGDGQWLVVPNPVKRDLFGVLAWDESVMSYQCVDNVRDTGQSAHDVLHQFLEGRNG